MPPSFNFLFHTHVNGAYYHSPIAISFLKQDIATVSYPSFILHMYRSGEKHENLHCVVFEERAFHHKIKISLSKISEMLQ
jgi:hypothetical protein